MPDEDDNFRQGVAKYKEANVLRDAAQYLEAERLYADALPMLKAYLLNFSKFRLSSFEDAFRCSHFVIKWRLSRYTGRPVTG